MHVCVAAAAAAAAAMRVHSRTYVCTRMHMQLHAPIHKHDCMREWWQQQQQKKKEKAAAAASRSGS